MLRGQADYRRHSDFAVRGGGGPGASPVPPFKSQPMLTVHTRRPAEYPMLCALRAMVVISPGHRPARPGPLITAKPRGDRGQHLSITTIQHRRWQSWFPILWGPALDKDLGTEPATAA